MRFHSLSVDAVMRELETGTWMLVKTGRLAPLLGMITDRTRIVVPHMAAL